ncbi:MAG: protein kinase [Planctomycetales bacterium]|nr:protein kinase [Planctomycetales bacterium]
MLSIDEDARRKFEADWLSGTPSVSIREYLPRTSTQTYLGTLEELVCIDLEFRWRNCKNASASGDETVAGEDSLSPTRVEDYVREFPELGQSEILQRLVEQEIIARVNSGFVVEVSEYRSRFPGVPFDDSLFEQHTVVQPTDASGNVIEQVSYPRQFGAYVITSELGRGGMGAVYRARQPSAGREVAIKIADVSSLNAASRNMVAARFETEAHAASSLVHDHVVPIYDVGVIDGFPYYAMRLVEGGDLAGMSKQEPLEPKRAVKYILGVARGIAVAHSRGMLHRDIKPQNILVDNVTDRSMLTDFGLARFMLDDSGLTQTGQVLGTPSYMPPEQVRDSSKIDGRADIYSLGGTLYQLLTGKPPFRAADLQETLRQVMVDDPVPTTRINSAIPVDVDTICLKCLEKEPEARYQTADELVEDLERFLDGRPILAKPASPLTKLKKWCNRNRALAGTLATTVAAVIVALVVSFYGWSAQTLLATEQTRFAMEQSESAKEQSRLKDVANGEKAKAVTAVGQLLDTLNDFHTQVSSDPVMTTPDLAPLRKQLLERALEIYPQVVALSESTLSQAHRAAALVKLGTLMLDLEQSPDTAGTHFGEANASIETLTPQQQQTELMLEAKSSALNGLALVSQKKGDVQAAIEYFRQAGEVRRKWTELWPDSLEAKRKLANALMNEGLLLAANNDLASAEGRQMTAQAIRGKALDEGTDDPKIRRDYAKGAFNLAMLHWRAGELSQVVDALNTSSSILRELANASMADANLWKLLETSLIYEAEFTAEIGGPASYGRATKLLDESLADLTSLIQLSAKNPTACLPLIELYQQGLETLLRIQSHPELKPEWTTPNAATAWEQLSALLKTVALDIESQGEMAQNDVALNQLALRRVISLRQKSLLLLAEAHRIGSLADSGDNSSSDAQVLDLQKAALDLLDQGLALCEKHIADSALNSSFQMQRESLRQLRSAVVPIQ